MGTNCNVCSNKCWGIEGQDGSCCTLENRDWIMGPIMDGHEFIENLSKKLGEPVNYDDIFIEYEEVYSDTYYGTSKSSIIDALDENDNYILCMDVKGALKLKSILRNRKFM